jgi:hypothetical protein
VDPANGFDVPSKLGVQTADLTSRDPASTGDAAGPCIVSAASTSDRIPSG